MEYRFVLNFNERIMHEKQMKSLEKGGVTTLDFTNESWMEKNLYVGKFRLSPGSEYEEKSLKNTDFRRKYDLLIAAVCRNNQDVYFPNGDFVLLSGDIILAVGNIVQIDLLTTDKNKIELDRNTLRTIHEYSKEKNKDPDSTINAVSLVVDPSSGLYNKSLLDSEMGRRGGAFVVGIENNKGYKINPPASEVFQDGDIIWVIGNKESIRKLIDENFYF
jgi:CPA2 family monovalent cation:H+ antiporter-2